MKRVALCCLCASPSSSPRVNPGRRVGRAKQSSNKAKRPQRALFPNYIYASVSIEKSSPFPPPFVQSPRIHNLRRFDFRLYDTLYDPYLTTRTTLKTHSTPPITSKMFAKSFVALAVAAASVLGQQINTPASLTVCQPTLLSWSGGQAPYFLSVIPGGQASAAALKDFGEQTDNQETWNVDLPAGTSITLKLTDSTGNTVYSSPVTIGAGTSTSCLNAAASGSSSAASSASGSSTASGTGVVGGASSAVSSAAASASSYVSLAFSHARSF